VRRKGTRRGDEKKEKNPQNQSLKYRGGYQIRKKVRKTAEKGEKKSIKIRGIVGARGGPKLVSQRKKKKKLKSSGKQERRKGQREDRRGQGRREEEGEKEKKIKVLSGLEKGFRVSSGSQKNLFRTKSSGHGRKKRERVKGKQR